MSFFGFNNSFSRGVKTESVPKGAKEIDFDDTFDGLEGRLDDSKDEANLDTFGDDAFDAGPVGNDFDFFGQTAHLAQALEKERIDAKPPQAAQQPARKENNGNSFSHARDQPGSAYQASAPPPSTSKPLLGPSKPFKTGYEQYSIPDLVVDKDLWGYTKQKTAPASTATPPVVSANQPGDSTQQGARKIFSLEEIESGFRPANTTVPAPPGFSQQPPVTAPSLNHGMLPAGALPPGIPGHPQLMGLPNNGVPMSESHHFPPGMHHPPPHPMGYPADMRALPPGVMPHQLPDPRMFPAGIIPPGGPPPSMPPGFQFPDGRPYPANPSPAQMKVPPVQPAGTTADSSANGSNPEQLSRRIQKIQMMSKGNGLMTPHDKSFISRIQLQQLMSVVGSVEENASQNTFLEDFYYQVYSMITHGKDVLPNQQQSVQSSSRYGYGRAVNGHVDSHIQRMQQQVARAIEAAKSRPKMTQLAIEGSLGTISFSNSKTPKPLLKVRADARPKRSVSSQLVGPPNAAHSKGGDEPLRYRQTLQDLEKMYMLLLALEDHKRVIAPPAGPGAPPGATEAYNSWNTEMNSLNQKLWDYTRVRDTPSGAKNLQPFIAMLCHTKGKKMVQRIFNHADNDLRLTILTLVVLNLPSLPTVLHYGSEHFQRDHVVPFMSCVIPCIFGQIGQCSLDTISTLLETSVAINVPKAINTRPGKEIFTMLVSRAELLHEGAGADGLATSDGSRLRYRDAFNKFFSALEPTLPFLFYNMPKEDREDDLHVWHFLAAIGVASDQQLQQQERLVKGVKDHVMDAVAISRHPETTVEVSNKTLQKVNLFMNSLGLDVEQL